MYTVLEVLKELNISQSTLNYWVKKLGIEKKYGNNRERLFTQKDIEKILKAREKTNYN